MPKIDTTSQGGRLQYFLNALNLSQADLAKQLSTSKATINRYIRNKTAIGKHNLNRIKLLFPALNTAWLEYNIGDPGLEDYIRLTREEQYIAKISNLQSEIERLKIENNQLKQKLNESNINRPADIFNS